MPLIAEDKIQIVNSFDDEWPDVWGFLFLDQGAAPSCLFDAIERRGVSRVEIEEFAAHLSKMKYSQLIALAKRDIVSDSPSPAIVVLRRTPNSDILEFAKKLCHREDNVEREIGLLILMDRTEECSTPEYEAFICDLLAQEQSPNVISAAIYAISKLHLSNALPKIVRFAEHQDSKVREAVAYAISNHEEPELVAATLKLMKDSCLEVRSWAIYLLSSNEEISGPDVETALLEAVHDPLNEREDRGAAILGLAKRHVDAAEKLIHASLNERFSCPAIFEAVMEMPSASYLPELELLRTEFSFGAYESSLLDRALEAVKSL